MTKMSNIIISQISQNNKPKKIFQTSVMKNIKLHAIQIKKEQYRKHLERLTHIYKDDKEKKKIIKDSKSFDKLMAITHRLRDTSNKFRIKHKQQEEKLLTSRGQTKTNCSLITTPRKPLEISPSLKNDKIKHDQKILEKENKDMFFRLIKVKPTIRIDKLSYQFNQTRKVPFFTKSNNLTQMDFSSILNSSIIRPDDPKKISIKLHNQNEEVMKIRFFDDIKEILNFEKLYFLQVRNIQGKTIESGCFSVKELMQSEVCIFKKKQQHIDIIDVKELFHEMKSITKGSFYIEQKKGESETENQNYIFFIYPNKRITVVGAHIESKNLKVKSKKHKTSVQQYEDSNLPEINRLIDR